ncbi:hypothetical protein [Prescottella agglutinans]|uniref:Uncharacterized protein n=1 Tax=Prescottella agglutinans TaxID=1644129 RepID=A0ABT6M9M3_9NOCA|nr:hypothetical protein [Prescottella agglutinans]MDH6281007.1 hypothetical protein [Prescottella agglutinans]
MERLLAEPAADAAPTVYIVDEMEVVPGRAREFVASYLEQYAPGARARGLTLDRILVSPPVWLTDQSNTVTVTWTVTGADAWWQQRWAAGRDPAVAAWWAAADESLVSRRRTTSSALGDLEVVTDV